jgi:hypothetical protein
MAEKLSKNLRSIGSLIRLGNLKQTGNEIRELIQKA